MKTYPLVSQPTAFIGREDELAKIAGLLLTPDCRLLTLTGSGGVGKTRLALEAAQQCASFSSAHFVPLQPLTSPDFMFSAIGDAVAIQFSSGADPKRQLLDYLSEKSLLLVLDNFEHLLSGVDFLSDILAAAPGVKLLITSRERLYLREEWVFEVGGLDYPTAETEVDIEQYSAVALFVRQARQANASFTLTDGQKPAVIRICRLVGGLPLGIELAAAWVRALSCEAIADQIAHSLDILETPARNVEPRHRTMRAAFEPTWQRLSATEQDGFRKLSVFRGGFTREAAEAVAGATLRTLSALVDKSLVRLNANGRYDLHELLRQYGAERLNESPAETEQTHGRHCSYYAHLMEQQWPRLIGSEIKAALQDIYTDLDNVRGAWDWAISHGKAAEVEAAMRSLWFFYGVGVRHLEGVQVFAGAAHAFSEDSTIYAKLLARWGELTDLTGLAEDARRMLEESQVRLRQLNVQDDLAFVLYRLVQVLQAVDSDSPKQADYLEESLAIYTALHNHYGIGEVLVYWGGLHVRQFVHYRREHDLRKAQQYMDESLQAFQEHGSQFGIAVAYQRLGGVAYWQGDYQRAWQYAQISLEFFREMSIGWGLIWSLFNAGYAACGLGNYPDARRCDLEVLLFRLKIGWRNFDTWTLTSIHLTAAIFIGEELHERAYELLGVIDERCKRFDMRRDYAFLFLLPRLNEALLPPLAAAVERGRKRELDSVVQEILAELQPPANDTSAPFLPPQPLTESLNPRELEILQLLSDGLNSREVAQRLYLSVTTVRWYLRQIYSKLDAHSRSEAIARAKALKLLA